MNINMEKAPLYILHISDTHLFKNPSDSLLGVNTQDSFQAVLNKITTDEPKIDFILHSGDMSQDGSQASYQRVGELLETLQVPVYCVPGNHDDPRVMNQIFPHENISMQHVIIPNQSWQLILLNSEKLGAVEGHLALEELENLRHALEANPDHRAIIMFHHQPIPVGCEWLDNLGLTNAAEFWQLISRYPNVHSVFFGHVHQEFEGNKNGISCYSAPATCIQFKRKQNHFGIEKLPPGYRWIRLHDDGRLETGVKRTAEYVGVFEEHAKGYK